MKIKGQTKKKMGFEQVVDLVCSRINRVKKKNDGVWASCVFGF